MLLRFSKSFEIYIQRINHIIDHFLAILLGKIYKMYKE